MKEDSRLLLAGGAGFIGSHLVRHCLQRWPGCRVTVIDALTYAGSIENLAPLLDEARLRFVHGDICDIETVARIMPGHTHVVNLAAATHVDRSIREADPFTRTNVVGTGVLLDAARRFEVERYLQVSTDEIYGDIAAPGRATEGTMLRPSSPYSATKAGGDLLVAAYHLTHGLPVLITRGSNTYGPRQHPEKLIPLAITNALSGLPLPVYGDGLQQRDWMHVDDHCAGIATVLEQGEPGGVYNLGAGREHSNLSVVERIVALTGADRAQVRHVTDRPGHDRRYALDMRKANALGWRPAVPLETGLELTVRWYSENADWWRRLRSGSFQDYYREQYDERLAGSEPE